MTMTTSSQLFAEFLGLYIAKADIPVRLMRYVQRNPCPFESLNTKMAFAQLRGAPDLSDPILYQFVMKTFGGKL